MLLGTVLAAHAGCTTKGGYLAALTEDLLDKAVSYSVAGDIAALQTLMDAGLVFSLKSGVTVYIEDTKIFSGKVEIRPAGVTSTVWTVLEAVNCD